jgi:hypothetical protein
MPDTRAELFIDWMGLIDRYTLNRALTGLTQEEFEWEPHAGAWGIRPRAACTTVVPPLTPELPRRRDAAAKGLSDLLSQP